MKIANLNELAKLPVSHDPHLLKKVMVQNGVVPHVTGFAQAIVPSLESVSLHAHSDKWEVFLVESGVGVMTVDGQKYPLKPGTCVVIEPDEKHNMANTGKEDLVLTYFGVKSLDQKDDAGEGK